MAFDFNTAKKVSDSGSDFDFSTANPASGLDVFLSSLKAAAPIAAKAAGAPILPQNPLATKEGLGVGMGAVQAITGGYGMPALRKLPGGSALPVPTAKEELAGQALGTVGLVSALPAAAVSRLPVAAKAILPAAAGYAMNPSETEIEPVVSGKRAVGAAMGVAGQIVGSTSGVVTKLLKPELRDALKRALRFGKNDTSVDRNLDLAIPELIKTDKSVVDSIAKANSADGSLEKLVNVAAEARKRKWDAIQSMLGEANNASWFEPVGEGSVVSGSSRGAGGIINDFSGVQKSLPMGALPKTTEEAIAYGKTIKNNPETQMALYEQWKSVNRAAEITYKKPDATKEEISAAFQAVQRAQFLREAVQEATGTDNIGAALKKITAAKSSKGNAIPDGGVIYDTVKKRIIISGSQIGDAIRRSISKRTREVFPETARSIEKMADRYDRLSLTPNQAEDFLEGANKDLASAYYSKGDAAKYVARGDDHVMATYAEAKALRQSLQDAIDSVSGKGAQFKRMKEEMGALMHIFNVGRGRINVHQRQSPISLQEAWHYAGGMADIFGGLATGNAYGMARGAARIGLSRIAKGVNDPDTMIYRGFKNYGTQRLPAGQIGSLVGVESASGLSNFLNDQQDE